MTDDAQRARRRAHNAHALERCNAMGRTAGSILWQPLENRAGKWFMPDGSELSEAPIEWRSERLSTILDEMDAVQAVAAVADPGKAYVEGLDIADWKAAVDEQFDAGQAKSAPRIVTRVPMPPAMGAHPDAPNPHAWAARCAAAREAERQEAASKTAPIWDLLDAISKSVPDEVWDTVPKDLSTRGSSTPTLAEMIGNAEPGGLVVVHGPSTISLEELRADVKDAVAICMDNLEKAISKPDPMFAEVPEPFKQYRRSQIAELRPYLPGEDASWIPGEVSVSAEDVKAGSPKPGDMIARNPKNHADQWLVAERYFKDNFEPV